MAKNIELMGAVFPDVPSIKLPQYGGGLVSFDDTSDADAVAGDIAQGKTAYVNGVKVVGTNQGGGGGSWTLLASTTVLAQKSSAGVSDLKTINIGEKWVSTAHYLIYVRVRDTAGVRRGYFWGSDSFYWNPAKANNPSTTGTIGGVSTCVLVRYNDSGKYSSTGVYGSGKYGVFVGTITQDGVATISVQYNSSTTGTIDGTYSVEIYFLDYPDGVGFFDATQYSE